MKVSDMHVVGPSLLLLLICIQILVIEEFTVVKSPSRNIVLPRKRTINKSRIPIINKTAPHAHHPVTCSPQVINRYRILEPVISTNRVPMEMVPSANVTSPNYTVITLLNPKERYALCDRILVRIEARDNLNRLKQYGDDVFRVKLISRTPYAAVIADRFVDYRNGTYLASFPLVWEGEMHIEVLLVHPAEAVPLFAPSLRGARAYAYNYVGEFATVDEGGVKYAENVTCSDSPLEPPFCNFSDRYVHAPLYCKMPKNESLSCSHWEGYHQDVSKTFRNLNHEVDKSMNKILDITRKSVHHSIGPITVTDIKYPVSYVSLDRLLYCKASDPPPSHPNGFFFRQTWIPFSCKIVNFTSPEIHKCLQGKVVRFYGDSTVQQLFLNLKYRLNCSAKRLPPPRDSDKRDILCQTENITLYFHFHGIPNGRSKRVHLFYAQRAIDNINATSNQVIVLSYWTHFAFAGLAYLEKRLQGIREAVYRLKARSPDLKVVVKGAHTRDYHSPALMLVSSDWHTYRQELLIRQMFRHDTLFGYLNAWDITQAQPFHELTHPSPPIIDNFVNLLLTYLCLDQ